jgi:hypothetical protein
MFDSPSGGFKNTVGLLGTELSAEQMRILETLVHESILILTESGGQQHFSGVKSSRHRLIVKARFYRRRSG